MYALLRKLLPAIVLAAALPAAAQPLTVETPRDWVLDAQLGGYYPDLDSEFGSATPFADIYGTDDRLLFQLSIEKLIWKGFGTFGLGLSSGYSEFYGRALFTTGSQSGQASSDNDSLHVVPIQAFAAYRFDVTAQEWSIPLVPYGKIGTGAWLWWTGGKDGARAGFSASAGLALHLDFFDPRLAREFDREIGVNNSYIYFDYTYWNVNGFGSDGFDLSDNSILSGGMSFEF